MLSNRATLESYAFANPHNNSVTVTQPDGGVALDPHDSRLTQVSNMDGMLWTGGGTCAGTQQGRQRLQRQEFVILTNGGNNPTPQGRTWQQND